MVHLTGKLTLPAPEIVKGARISVATLKAIQTGATPTATPQPILVAVCARACRSRLRQAGISIPGSHAEVLQLSRDLRGKDVAGLASLEAELAVLEAEQRTDLHVRFRYWHDLTDCWKRTMVHTRYHHATVDNPRGHRSSWAKIRPVASILDNVCAELSEDFKTFTQRVCDAVHERPRRIAELQCRVRNQRGPHHPQ